jgi:hypothetical protein
MAIVAAEVDGHAVKLPRSHVRPAELLTAVKAQHPKASLANVLATTHLGVQIRPFRFDDDAERAVQGEL